MTIVIGMMGPAGAGKSSIAQHLIDKYGATRYSFAGPLKEMVGRALEFSHEQLWGTQAQKEEPDPRYGGKSARWFLQRIGTEGCRKTFGDMFWTTQLLKRIKREAPEIAVIEDARFVNEANAIRAFDITYAKQLQRVGFVWRLETPDRETTADATHASEREWMDAPYDYVIAPTRRGLDILYSLVDDTMRAMGLHRKDATPL